MKFKVQLVISDDECEREIQDIVTLDKEFESIEDLGLKIEEAKGVLRTLQQGIVEHQTETFNRDHRCCPQCGNRRRVKGSYPVVFRTLFGNIEVQISRYYHCQCEPGDAKTFSPLKQELSEHTSPELSYLETKWASLIAYGATTKILKDVLPIDDKLCRSTVRNHLLKVAEREEASLGGEQVFFIEGCARDCGNLPRPDGPITVGIDGGYVRDWVEKKSHFQVIVGKSVTETETPNTLDSFRTTTRNQSGAWPRCWSRKECK